MVSENVAMKLREIAFFYRHLAESAEKITSNEPEEFLFYLSAFLGAAEARLQVVKLGG
jgi:hypothetical protein